MVDHGDERQDYDRVPAPRHPRRRRHRPARHGEADRRRPRGGGRADDARGDRPPAHLPPHARRRRRGMRDGGFLARARARPQHRDPVRRQGVHEPDPGPPRPTPTWRTTSRRSGSCSSPARKLALAGNGSDQRRRSWRRACSRSLAAAARTRSASPRRGTAADFRAEVVEFDATRSAASPRRRGRRRDPAAGPLQRRERACRACRRRGRSASPRARGRVLLARADRAPGRFEPVTRGSRSRC